MLSTEHPYAEEEGRKGEPSALGDSTSADFGSTPQSASHNTEGGTLTDVSAFLNRLYELATQYTR